jgi:hypothetical protein
MDEPTERHLTWIAEDLVALLGPRGALLALDADVGPPATLRARYRLGPATGEAVGRGASLVEAHADLRRTIADGWLGLLLADSIVIRRPRHRRVRLIGAVVSYAFVAVALLVGPLVIALAKSLTVT